jgi:hypothetical protein
MPSAWKGRSGYCKISRRALPLSHIQLAAGVPHKTGGVQVATEIVVAATARAARAAAERRRIEAAFRNRRKPVVMRTTTAANIVLTNAINAILAVNAILTIPERLRRVRSLPTKEGVLTWEQCSRVLVPTKLLREPAEGGAGKWVDRGYFGCTLPLRTACSKPRPLPVYRPTTGIEREHPRNQRVAMTKRSRINDRSQKDAHRVAIWPRWILRSP